MIETATRSIGSQSKRQTWVRCESPEDFAYWFARCRGLLRFIACQMLGDSETADVAVENCGKTAFRSPRAFDREGAFRSWLLRILIDEALILLRQRRASRYQCAHLRSSI